MPDLSWIIETIKALGVAGGPVFAVLWWLERVERQACQAETKASLIQVLTVASQAASSVTEVTKAVAALAESSRDVAQLVRSLLSAQLSRERGVT